MATYAQDTSVPVEKSRAEIESILAKYGATRFAYMIGDTDAVIMFMLGGKAVKFTLPLPDINAEEFQIQRFERMGRLIRREQRSPESARKVWEQACRSRWRALALGVKAKLVFCESGITTFESEFLAHFVLPGGKTLGQRVIPELEEMSRSGKMPTSLLLTSGE